MASPHIITRNLVILVVLFTTAAFIIEKDALHKKKYSVQITEFRDGKPKPKTIEDAIEFKDGKVYSDFAASDKLGFTKFMKYELKKDSTYTEDDVEKRYFELESISTNENDETLYMSIKIDDYEIEGSMKLTKGDKPKKYYEFAGKEKVKK